MQVIVTAVLMAAAGGLGWGIRGQYGHETGAMIAGVLMGWVVALRFLPGVPVLKMFRTVSMCALGISIGGSMTYGQTLGLTQNAEVIGNWSAFGWGMLGLAIKGGIWFGFAGLFLGLALSQAQMRTRDILVLFVVGGLVYPLGIWLWNSPFDPSRNQLPWLYFSETPAWYPSKESLKPRPECWGGLLLSLVGMTVMLGWRMQTVLAGRLAAWGLLAGAVGFPAGQCVQAYHAWNAEQMAESANAALLSLVNWWNMMEMTFGAVAGGILGLGLCMHRDKFNMAMSATNEPLSTSWETLLLSFHLVLLMASTVMDLPAVELYQQYGLLLVVLPTIGVLGGQLWPFLLPTLIVLLPIVLKTAQHFSDLQAGTGDPIATGWSSWLLLALPTLLMLVFAATAYGWRNKSSSLLLSRWGLASSVIVYFSINFGFFDFPWPWQTWTSRTPSGFIMAAQSAVLLVASWLPAAGSQRR